MGLRHRADWLTILLYLILVAIGWLAIYAADGTYTITDTSFSI